MAEKDITFETEENPGAIKIANEVVLIIAAQALNDIKGIHLAASAAEGFVGKLVKKPAQRGVRIYLNDEAINLIRTFPRRVGVPWIFFRAKSGKRVVSLFSFWNKLRNDLGRPTLRLNDLRHAFVYSLIQEGASYEDVRTRLGHYSAEVFQLQSELLGQQAGLITGGLRA